MRKFATYVFSCVFLFGVVGCTNKNPEGNPISSTNISNEVLPRNEIDTGSSSVAIENYIPSEETNEPYAPPVEGEMLEHIEAMLPILDSVMRVMSGLNSMYSHDVFPISYAPRDEEFFWYTLYCMGNNWAYNHPLVKYGERGHIVPRRLMQEFAAAAFFDYSDLLPVPEIFKEIIVYDDYLDSYHLEVSDIGATEPRIISATSFEVDSASVTAGRFNPNDELIYAVHFTLAANSYADGIAEPTYRYTVWSAVGEGGQANEFPEIHFESGFVDAEAVAGIWESDAGLTLTVLDYADNRLTFYFLDESAPITLPMDLDGRVEWETELPNGETETFALVFYGDRFEYQLGDNNAVQFFR